MDSRRARYLGEPDENVFTESPFLCVEVLSPDDTALEVRIKVDEYLAWRVAYIWIVDPVSAGGEIHARDRIERACDGRFRASDIEGDLRKLNNFDNAATTEVQQTIRSRLAQMLPAQEPRWKTPKTLHHRLRNPRTSS
jgi:hypothetical protein